MFGIVRRKGRDWIAAGQPSQSLPSGLTGRLSEVCELLAASLKGVAAVAIVGLYRREVFPKRFPVAAP
jgi:hypothetical protein